jgi:hypothetical protein
MATAPTLFDLFSDANAKGHGALILAWHRELMKVPCPFPTTAVAREDAASWVMVLLLERRGDPLAGVAPHAQESYAATMFRNRLVGAWKSAAGRECPLEYDLGGERMVLDVVHSGPSAEVELARREMDARFETLLRAFIAAQRGGQAVLLETLRTLLHLRATGMTARGLLGARPDFIQQRNAMQKRFERLRHRLLQFIADQRDDGALGVEDAELFAAQVATLRLK